jgi:integrase
MSNFCLFINENPDTIIENRVQNLTNKNILEREQYEQKIKTYLQSLEKKKITVQPVLTVIGGFFKNNSNYLRIHLGNNVKYSKEGKRKKYSPNREEVKKILAVANCKRDELIVTLAYHCGLVPEDVVGICIGQYPTEPWKHFTGIRGKTGSTWHGVSTPEGCKFLNEYMIIRGGQKGEPLFMGREGPLNGVALSEIISTLVKRAGLSHIDGLTAKSFRDGRFNALRTAKIDIPIREAMMGHTNNIYHIYGASDEVERLVVEAMRTVYPYIRLINDPQENAAASDEYGILAILKEMLPDLQMIREKMNNGTMLDLEDPEIVEKLCALGFQQVKPGKSC